MDEIVYEVLVKYYHALELKGYMADPHVAKLLVLCFYRDFIAEDYRGLISKEDYRLIEKALNCLYGTSCLIPYPDYLKMGKLSLGEMTELVQRVKALEEAQVVKVVHDLGSIEDNTQSDVILTMEDE